MKRTWWMLVIAGILLASIAYIGGEWDNLTLRGSGYQLANYTPELVWLYREDRNRTVVIDPQIVDFAVRGDYIMVLRMVTDIVDCQDTRGRQYMLTHYTGKKEYWIVGRRNRGEIGPLGERAFAAWLQKHDMAVPSLRIPESYRINTEAFHIDIQKCIRINSQPASLE